MGETGGPVELIAAIARLKYELMPGFLGPMLHRAEPPRRLAGYNLAHMAYSMVQPDARFEDMSVAGFIIECDGGDGWHQHHNRKVYESQGVAMVSLLQIQSNMPRSLAFRIRPVYLLGPVATRLHNIFKIVSDEKTQ
jgi:hypothetical protein